MSSKTQPIIILANDLGVMRIGVGTTKITCIGAREPFDHPHIVLEMGQSKEITCPYCSTLYWLQPGLAPDQVDPIEAIYFSG